MMFSRIQGRLPHAVQAPYARLLSTKRITMIPGDGVGPELMISVRDVFKAAKVPVEFNQICLSEFDGTNDPAHITSVINSIRETGSCLMGHIEANIEGLACTESTAFRIRNELGVYANVVRIKSLEGVTTRHSNLDFVLVREQTEGEYKALEHEPVPGVVESLKITTRENSEKICKFTFDFALHNGRKKVTCVHKANIMKKGDGLFLNTFHEIAKLYPMIESNDMIVDNTCMQMVSNPTQFDVMVMPNLYGNIIDNLASGMVGGAGVVPGECYSTEYAIFEPGARQSYLQGVGKNIANPTAMLLASANMLTHMSLDQYGTRIRNAVTKTIKSKTAQTDDIGGSATTTQFTQEVINNL